MMAETRKSDYRIDIRYVKLKDKKDYKKKI